MRGHFEYMKYVVSHKWFVMLECFRRGLIWRGLAHDWDKFLPSMFLAYSRHFYRSDGSKKQVRDKTGYYKPTDTGDAAFDAAWFGHARRSRHHWQWWCVADGETVGRPFPMGEADAAEMVCDWYGASRAQGVESTVGEWFEKNRLRMTLHADSLGLVLGELRRRGEKVYD